MEELVKFTLLTRDVAPYLVDRYSERKESAEALSKRVNQRGFERPSPTAVPETNGAPKDHAHTPDRLLTTHGGLSFLRFQLRQAVIR